YAGIIRLFGEYRAEAALFMGNRIGAWGVEMTLSSAEGNGYPEAAGIGFILEKEELRGTFFCRTAHVAEVSLPESLDAEAFSLYVDSVPHPFQRVRDRRIRFRLPPGRHAWQWTAGLPVP